MPVHMRAPPAQRAPGVQGQTCPRRLACLHFQPGKRAAFLSGNFLVKAFFSLWSSSL